MKSAIYHLGNVYFDPTTRVVATGDGQQVQLRNKSKAVLEYLLGRPNLTVSKSEILDAIWTDVSASDESLVQCIADIRRVIGTDARTIVETVPREGYRLNLPQTHRSTPRARFWVTGILVGAVVVAGWFFWTPPILEPASVEPVAVEQTSGPPGTKNPQAYLEVLQGRLFANEFGLSQSLDAERHFRRAIALDPSYARAHAELGALIAVRFENNWSILQDADKEKALHYAERAVELKPDLWLGHYALGRLHSVFSNPAEAEQHLRMAMSLRPENEDARAYLGVVLNFQGKAEEAVRILQQAIATHPNPPFWYYFGLGHALFNVGRIEAARAALEQCLEIAGNSPYCMRYLLAVYAELAETEKVDFIARTYEAMGFELSISAIISLMPFHHQHDLAQLEQGLRKAGLPN